MTRTRIQRSTAALAAVAALTLAACGSDDGGTSAPPQPEGPADITLVGTDSLKFDPGSAEADAGEIIVALESLNVGHNFLVEVDGEEVLVVESGAGETAKGAIELEAGEYTFFCNVPGHREAGMEGTLTVS